MKYSDQMAVEREQLIGQKFGLLTIVECFKTEKLKTKKIPRRVKCRCDCGEMVIRDYYAVKTATTISCGCETKRKTVLNNKLRCTTHGFAGRKNRPPEYSAWAKMKERCLDPKNKNFNIYGGRAIPVLIAPEWINDFMAFFNYVGEKPEPKKLYSLDRIDNNGNYEPGNVRWATQKEQVNNSSVIKPKIVIHCHFCGKEDRVTPSLFGKKYCDRLCMAKAKKPKT